jgi:hypothetical protein
MSVVRNPNLGPSQIRLKRRRLFWVRFSIVLFFLLVIVLGLAILSGHQKVIINTINISGNTSVSNDEILEIINRDLEGRYWGLFSRKNYLIFPRFEIKRFLLKGLKEIKEVNVSWGKWQIINIDITERKPHSVWCGPDPKAINPTCYFVDNEGYIYSQAPDFTGNMFIRSYGNIAPGQLNNANSVDTIGSYFLPKYTYIQIFNLIQILEQNNIEVTSYYFDSFDYRFQLKVGPEIIFNDKNGFGQVFQNLFSAIQTGNLDLERDADKINYIDLRFDNKIVVGKK